jgi:hypothetical protein
MDNDPTARAVTPVRPPEPSMSTLHLVLAQLLGS